MDGKIRLEVIVDRTSIEIFANDGGIYMPVGVILVDNSPEVKVFSRDGKTHLNYLKVYELESIWQ